MGFLERHFHLVRKQKENLTRPKKNYFVMFAEKNDLDYLSGEKPR